MEVKREDAESAAKEKALLKSLNSADRNAVAAASAARLDLLDSKVSGCAARKVAQTMIRPAAPAKIYDWAKQIANPVPHDAAAQRCPRQFSANQEHLSPSPGTRL